LAAEKLKSGNENNLASQGLMKARIERLEKEK